MHLFFFFFQPRSNLVAFFPFSKVDRGNSLLHLAVSLNGQRGVHVVSKPDQTTADADDKSTADDPYGSQSDKPAEGQGLLSRVYRAVLGSRNTPTGAKPTSAAKRARHAHDSAYVSKSKREIHQQYPGDVYLSSPCFYLHGVDYPRSSWEDRTMAIQLRYVSLTFAIDFGCCRTGGGCG